MSTLEERKRELAEEFSQFRDGFDRYSYLVELAGLLPPYPDHLRTEDRLVRGCQSHVWLDIRPGGGLFQFAGDSDTLILKGVLLLLQDLFNGLPVEEVAGGQVDFTALTGLENGLPIDRQKGVGYILRSLRQAAERASQKTGAGAL